MTTVTQATVDAYATDGAVRLPGLFADWVDVIAEGIDRNMAAPSEFGAENVEEGGSGRFFDDYCNWNRIPEFERVIRESDLRDAAASLMQSDVVQMFHDHVLVKEPGTPKPTPWHSDSPYYFVSGQQTVSFWIPIDPVSEATLRVIRGSHLWEKDVLPVRWLSDTDFYADSDQYLPVPDPDAEPDRFDVLEWDLAPGDAIAFNYRAVHGARGNRSATRRRALSLRLVGDDARFVERPGPTSPPFHGHGMTDGDRLRTDWFPYLSASS
jgi:ectoine hydroxylase-related dioxygenase (phytanoyl-CoA dioxygenase family)